MPTPSPAQPLVVLGVTVMDPPIHFSQSVKSSHDRPIPSHPALPLGGRGGLLPSTLILPFCCLLPRAGPPSPSPSIHPPIPSPLWPVLPSSWTSPFPLSSLIPVLILLLAPPHPHSWGLGSHSPRLLPSSASCLVSLFSSPSLVLFALVVWVWSGPVRSGFALPFSPCLALPCLALGLACPALVWFGFNSRLITFSRSLPLSRLLSDGGQGPDFPLPF